METALDDPYPSIILLAITQLPITFYLVNGLGILFLLLISGLVSGSEVAFFSLSHDQIQEVKNSTVKSEQHISRLVLDPKRLLATILILNNLVNIFIVTISTYATWKVVGNKDAGGIVIVALILKEKKTPLH